MCNLSVDEHNLDSEGIVVLFLIGRAINGAGVILCLFSKRVTENQRDHLLTTTLPVPIS